MRMKGHCLAYDTSKFHPEYLPRDVREAKIMYDKHFAEIGARYADVIEDFDVTNELLCRRFFNKEQPALINEYDYLEWVFEVAKKYFPYNGRLINEAAGLGDGDSTSPHAVLYDDRENAEKRRVLQQGKLAGALVLAARG